jgi:hypothetical protein
MKFKRIRLTIVGILFCFSSFAQFEPLKNTILLADSFNISHSREKIFIHYDKPYYTINDTLWLKGYIVSARDCSATDSSGIAYIEISKSSGELIKRISTYCAAGIFYSGIRLNEEDFKQGGYVLRAYTNYMRNFGDSLFFESQFKIIDPDNSEWRLSVQDIKLVNKKFSLSASIIPLLKESAGQQKIAVVLRSNGKTIFRKDILTGKNGYISIDTLLDKELRDNTAQLEISGDKQLKIYLPVPVSRQQQIDLQFLPEGGTFIANKRQCLGFKAVNIWGNGYDVKGKIENSKKQVVATFSSVHNGMGTVWITPEANEKYIATLDNGLTFQIPLPQQSGIQLQVINQPGSDSVEIIVDASPDLYGHRYFFRASARGLSYAMGTIRVKDEPYRLLISKKAFPSGISRFTLYDSSLQPVNERAILLWHHDGLKLDMVAQQPVYNSRDSVHILLSAKNSNNEPAIGSFSIAVIDTGRVQFSKYSENIISYLLLASEIKGKIEDPSYYFDAPIPEATEALMLTQGWVQYNHLFSKPEFEYEKEFLVKGKVTNLFNKPVDKADITLLGKTGKANTFILDTTTGKNGKFTFKDFPAFLTDTVTMLIRALNKKGKSFGIGIEVDTAIFPGLSSRTIYPNQNIILNDTLSGGYIRQQIKDYYKMKERKGYLPEVVVTGKVKIKGSKNLNESGGADQLITGKVLESMPKETLLDVLNKKMQGFHKGPLSRSQLQVYKRDGDLVVFIIDGYNISKAYDPVSESPTAFTDYIEAYLKYITAEEVAGIEIMNTSKNTFAYEKYYNLSSGLITYTFVEITTWSGNGAFNKKIPGMYLYRPLVPTIAKTFYSPRYSATEKSTDISDYRSTIYWKPDIITNEKGEAEISFYTSDSKSGYLVIAQGTDLKGGLGVVYFPLTIKK